MPGEMIREAAREMTDSAERADLLLVVERDHVLRRRRPSDGRPHHCRASRRSNRDLMIRELSAETGHESL